MLMLKTFVPRCLLVCFIMLLVLPSTAQSPNGSDEQVDPNTSFFMGRIRYSRNNGNDCSGVGENMTRIVSEVSTIRIGRETVVAFTDPKIFETPFLFMNGHNEFVLGDDELESLREDREGHHRDELGRRREEIGRLLGDLCHAQGGACLPGGR